MLKVLYFAQAASLAGCREEEWPAEGIHSVDDFWAEAERRHPALATLRAQCRIACGREYLREGDILRDGNEVAVIPPVSGG